MKPLLLIFSALISSGASFRPELSTTLDKIARWYRPQTYSLLTDIIGEVIKNIEGEKEINIEDFQIDPLNRLENVTVKSSVDVVIFETGSEDSGRFIDIKELTVPVNHFLANGEYDFGGISIFGLEIYGKGDFRVRVEDLRISASLLAKYSSARGWKVEKFDAKSSMKECRVIIENLMNGEPMGDFINFMANEILKIGVELLEGLVKEFNAEIRKELGDFINKLMGVDDNK